MLQRSAPRRLTQSVSAVVYRQGFHGIRYLSKHGHEIENWALFEPAELTEAAASEIGREDPDLHEAFRLFHLALG